ncbi:uncharacterized protein [Arachis hypogaea]|uniref:DUF1639 family protein n=1 Tax=Arachis hypogaea TaxID=3818 RepID=A0A444WUN9_ARAHY|nr:uncharacterized protein LOC112747748 isoform X2 [Arachis hypogaea]XP_025698375.1 uncharacterized protein LOC112800356 isoform X2 [Arachis hypogaea]QHO40422.1 DUF1639 family protein [Arachis hypogaea]RYQ81092.1 hypothetical protein Ahy_Scaffold1g107095 [Arachis hypogaea]
MATAPVKSQPLHNFSLPFLKWASKSHTKPNHRHRSPLSRDSSSSQLPPPADHDSEPETRRLGSRTVRYRFGFSSSHITEKSHTEQQEQEQQRQQTSDRAGNNVTDDDDGGGKRKREDGEEEAKGEGEELKVEKPWKLRPRKSAFPRGSGNGEAGAAVTGGPSSEPKSVRLREMADMQCQGDRKEKRKLWIALSKEEIEEDIFAITGSRPARRPEKRPKHVQKQLDCVFPGLWLVGATAEAYRVADAPAKR